ncbi:MAG: saccharopine dehydrogenase [Acidimicrobiia bacterium]|nr:saccharopine dehydrogenase [Acidimicrobiia bacterium]
MKVIVLGGSGTQGRAAVLDLARSEAVDEVVSADSDSAGLDSLRSVADLSKVRGEAVDARDHRELVGLMRSAAAVIDLLPRQFMANVCAAAVEAEVSVVNTNYAAGIAEFDGPARAAGVTIIPECGLDPGIDLILYGKAARRFDRLEVIRSYCGGIPEAAAADNPLKYKASWTWEGVLSSTMRDSLIIRDGRRVEIPAARQHDPEFVHEIDFPGLGTMEAIPNGMADQFIEQLGLGASIRETGRYALRWPGWSDFWRPLKAFGFFDRTPVTGLPAGTSPYDMLDKLLGPQLEYGDDEKDLVAMVNIFEGLVDGRPTRLTCRLLIERDLSTGLLAMSQAVGFTASIVAQMIAGGEIPEVGVLSPARHIPPARFFEELEIRGVTVDEYEGILE